MRPCSFLTTEEENPRQQFQKRMRERSRKAYPSAHEQRPVSIAIVVEERSIVADSFRRECLKRDRLCF
jgi:hypothetical protein